ICRYGLLCFGVIQWLLAVELPADELLRSNRETPIVRAIKRTRPSVVSINVRKTIQDDEPYGSNDRLRKVNGMGTGVIIDERGYIVTNYHVVQGVADVRVTLSDKTQLTARLIAHDPRTDLAIIKINTGKQLAVMPRGTSSDLMLGETVIAIGNAYGYKDTITVGHVSELNRTVEVSDEQTYFNLIQTDAAINPGNSGGPLVNINGEMIGINAAVRMGAQNIGFAIPVNPAMEIVAGLIRQENKSRLSLPVKVSTDFEFERPRLMVNNSREGLDLQKGDQIISIDGLDVTNLFDVERFMIGRRDGDQVSLKIRRGSETFGIQSELTASVVSPPTDRGVNNLEAKVWNIIGLKLAEIPSQEFRQLSTKYGGGLQVTHIRSGSQAMTQNIRPGDVLLGIHEWETTSLGHIAYIIDQEQVYTANYVEFFVLRNGEVLKGSFQLLPKN
ncbi:MAG: trypsin-like peptidase domain-containing protein, partial [Planctomycetota bacterium]|nr:trypsin-like peptidase domain-containing protein [Planctomycetota bacterium]